MKKAIFIICSFILLQVNVTANEQNINDPNTIIDEMFNEIVILKNNYSLKSKSLKQELTFLQEELYNTKNLERKVDLLIKKDRLKSKLDNLKKGEEKELSKIRFIKGLQIIKLLYEKILSLDHHYSSVYTFSEINKITNPHNFPEFKKAKEVIRKKKNRSLSMDFDVQSVLGINPLASATQAFVDFLSIDLTSKEKKKELKNLECIIDFSLSMYNDLNTIYFETTYLQSSNQSIKEEIETLFTDFTSPISYSSTLNECRSKDDWNTIIKQLNTFIEEKNKVDEEAQRKMLIDLEFSVDRLLQFITVYNDFINEGELFYRKFKTILSSYQNAEQCESQVPAEYNKLKNDIDNTLEKFNIAYKPVEINGSKMKEILYGINEYD